MEISLNDRVRIIKGLMKALQVTYKDLVTFSKVTENKAETKPVTPPSSSSDDDDFGNYNTADFQAFINRHKAEDAQIKEAIERENRPILNKTASNDIGMGSAFDMVEIDASDDNI